MTAVDLSLVVTAHNETFVCGPTMTAADLAVQAARDAGYTVQTIVALDKATPETTDYFHQPAFDHWERWEMDHGDLGRVRNALIPRTDGRHIAFLDADDLFSENWLARGLDTLTAAEARGERVIAHPEVNIVFDGGKYLLQNVDQDSPLFTPYFLYVRNGYDSLCLTPREAHLEVPYVHRDIPNGLSFQDWQFAVETMSRGWRHVVVRDTIIFKRRRDFSLVVESSGRKSILRSLPEMTIDRIRDLHR
ncbi:glycosyltransferase family A protein [Nocardioides coralli]|uniref:glycosyltransferase family A protein n=1 Tax=Nocardioides coralli TaxID=2872154 RepID=UPI001CA40B61|nr:glycosyltransferase family A protein [Nocardioides coralli]QZY28148.1 glycosyltransferase family 2 protein [Nocardioides coralli]